MGVATAYSNTFESRRIPYSPEAFRQEIRRVKRKRRIVVVLCVLLAILVACVITAVVVFKVPGSLRTVSNDNMAPAVSQGQTVLTQEVTVPVAGDVAIYHDASGATGITRIIAEPGSWVNIASDGKVVVSPSSLEGDPERGTTEDGAVIIASRQVPDSACFVMADSESDALTALYNPDNYVDVSRIDGRVLCRIWPITNIGVVK